MLAKRLSRLLCCAALPPRPTGIGLFTRRAGALPHVEWGYGCGC